MAVPQVDLAVVVEVAAAAEVVVEVAVEVVVAVDLLYVSAAAAEAAVGLLQVQVVVEVEVEAAALVFLRTAVPAVEEVVDGSAEEQRGYDQAEVAAGRRHLHRRRRHLDLRKVVRLVERLGGEPFVVAVGRGSASP